MESSDPSSVLPTRQSLLSRLRSWDNGESWAEFYQLYGQLLHGLARKAGLNATEADDIVQDTLLSVAKELPRFRYDPARGSFKSWLRLLVRRRIADYFRRKRHEMPHQVPMPAHEERNGSDQDPEAAEDPHEAWWNEEWERHVRTTALKRVQSQVSARQFQIFSCRVLQEWPMGRVTVALGVNAAQVYVATHRVGRLFRLAVVAVANEMEQPKVA